MVAVGARSCLVSSCRISHFGMKPVSGGSPPRERRIRGVREVSIGAFVQEVASALMLVALFSLNTRNVENVITKYVKRVRSVREGENWRTKIIQPRWAIEEYARIFRSWVWFNPPHPPIRVDIRPSKIKRVELVG